MRSDYTESVISQVIYVKLLKCRRMCTSAPSLAMYVHRAAVVLVCTDTLYSVVCRCQVQQELPDI